MGGVFHHTRCDHRSTAAQARRNRSCLHAVSMGSQYIGPSAPTHRKPPKLNQSLPRHRAAPTMPSDSGPAPGWVSSVSRPNAPSTYEHMMHQAASASVISSLRRELNEYKRRDRALKSQMQLQQQIAMLRATNAQLREQCSEPFIAALRQENQYLNQKTVELGLKLVRTEQALEQSRLENERIRGVQS